jgi:hypothetical protein
MSESKTTLSFWIGLLTGMVMGVFVFGISIMGQGVWEAGRMWGETICKGDQP